MSSPPIKVLFVCMGNICRSPTAEAVFAKIVRDRGLAERFVVHSAGTHAYHVGHGADLRSSEAASRRGYDLATHRARRVTRADFDEYDLIVAMDLENVAGLASLAPDALRSKISLFLEHC